MRTIRCLVGPMVLAGVLTTQTMGQTPVLTSFQGNGQLSWTNAVNSNSLYRVEWASQAGGPWYRTFDNISSLDGLSATSFTVSVPMFYRVVVATNQPPVGMVWIDGGDVELGQAGIATPVHTNFISGFWMDEMEVTKAKWTEVYNWAITNGYVFENAGMGKTNNHPVHTVNWYDCVKWCNARSQKDGLTPCYYTSPEQSTLYTDGTLNISNEWVNWSANGYRLPTVAEWEKAARGGRQGRLFPWGGDTIQHARANYSADTNSIPYDTSPTPDFHPDYSTGLEPYTSPAGSFPANGYGLHDMAGNVFEWCWDWHENYSTNYKTDPQGPVSGANRVFRGGSWNFFAQFPRCATRSFIIPEFESNFLGFRCARRS